MEYPDEVFIGVFGFLDIFSLELYSDRFWVK